MELLVSHSGELPISFPFSRSLSIVSRPSSSLLPRFWLTCYFLPGTIGVRLSAAWVLRHFRLTFVSLLPFLCFLRRCDSPSTSPRFSPASLFLSQPLPFQPSSTLRPSSLATGTTESGPPAPTVHLLPRSAAETRLEPTPSRSPAVFIAVCFIAVIAINVGGTRVYGEAEFCESNCDEPFARADASWSS
jgi:hypothetical protein